MLQDFIFRLRQRRRQQREQQLSHEADELFQICEHDNELYFTYGGHLVCPCTMFRWAPVEVVQKMREMYIKRRSQRQEQQECLSSET